MSGLKMRLHHLLRWSEKYTKTDMVYLAKGGSWLTFGQVINMGIGFAVSIAFANLFPKESFGTYKFILSAVAMIGIFSFIDIGTAINQAVARGFGNSLRQGFKANLKWSIGVPIAGIVVSGYYFLNDNLLLSFAFLLAGILTPLTASAGLYGSYLLGKKDFRRSTLYSMVRNIAPAAALIATLFLTQSLLAIIVVYFLSATLVSFVLYRMTEHAYRKENQNEDPGLVSYAGHLGVMGIIGQVADNIDKILVFHYLGAAPLAIYAFAIAPVEQLQGGKKILNALSLSKLSARSFDELQKSVPRRVGLLALYALALVAVYVPLIPYFYDFFYPQYHDSIFYSQLYSLTLFGVIGSVLDSHLVAHKKKKELYISRITYPLIKIVLLFVLIPSFGITGLIMTHIIVRALNGCLTYYFVAHPLREPSLATS